MPSVDSTTDTSQTVTKRRFGKARKFAILLILAAISALLGFIGWREWKVAGLARTARSAVAERRFADAQPTLSRWLELRPGSGEAHFLQAHVELAADRPQLALEHLVKAQAMGYPRDAAARIMAILKARAGKPAEAEPILREAFERGQGPAPEIDESLARIYMETYRLTEAKPVIDRWIQDAPADPRPYVYRVEIGKLEEEASSVLIKDLRAALLRDPKLDRVRLALAEELVKASRFDEADEEFAICLKHDPANVGALVGSGYRAMLRGDDAAATKFFDQALKLKPDDPVLLRERAVIDIQREELQPALARLDRAIALRPTDAASHHRRAIVLRRLGRAEQARQAQELVGRLKEEELQVEALRKKLLSSPGDLAMRVDLARLLLRRGPRDEALRWANVVLRDQPGHPEISRLLGDLYESEGNIGLANYYRSLAPTQSESR